jgi:hypothetical protein
MLLGTLRRGSGMTGFGGVWVAPVTAGPLADAAPSRPFGAGFGTGTVCANDIAVTIAAVTRSTPATRALRAAMVAANRMSGCLINASSCMAGRLFSVISGKSR